MIVREASDQELADWDSLTVARAGGHVLQSLAWARHRERSGWRPRHLLFDDGFGLLVLERPWPLIGGASAYVPRGPIAAGDPAELTALRVAEATAWLAGHGIDVIATDAEIPAMTGYPSLLAELGFHPIEEIQPSRHRLSLELDTSADEGRALAGIAKATRQRIRQAEASGIRIVRHDARVGADPGAGFVPAAGDSATTLDLALGAFYELLVATGERRGFGLGPRADYLAWWRTAYLAGYLVLLEAREAGTAGLGAGSGGAIAGLMLYRHGGRLSTAYSADRPDRRETHPGVFHLLRWRAIQLAIREGCPEIDLGGVDVAGARNEPRPGEAMYGLYQHKRSFGARWVELSGAHERVIRPRRYLVGRIASAATRRLRRARTARSGRGR